MKPTVPGLGSVTLPSRVHPPHSTSPSEPCPAQTPHQFQGKLQTLRELKAVCHAPEETSQPQLSFLFCSKPEACSHTTHTHTHTHTQMTSHNGEPCNTRVLSHICFFWGVT